MKPTNKLMKRLSLYLFLIFFTLQTPSQADDIRDFQIEGISIGDSLLDIATEKEINKAKSSEQFPNDKFIIYYLEELKPLKNYDWVSVTTKKNEKNYIVTNIGGAISYKKLDKCLELQKEIQKDVERLFKANDKQENIYASKQDKTGNSKVYGVQYYLKPYPSNESIAINCYHMTHASNLEKSLKVTVNSEEYAYFIINEAYK